MVKQGAGQAGQDLAEKILLAPDVFYAAHIMNNNEVFFGKGDVKRILDILKTRKSDKFKDIGNKLAMLRQGYLYHQGIQTDINDPDITGVKDITASEVSDAHKVQIFSDKNLHYIKQPINYKVVFQIWAT
jgi:hypothetical protein